MNIAPVIEYLALAKSLRLNNPNLPKPTFADFAKANALAMQCMVELPGDIWRSVLITLLSPDWGSVYDLVDELRHELHPTDPLDKETEFVFHGPAITRKFEGTKP